MGKFSDWILFPGTAAPKIREGIRNLGFALASELENFVSYGVPQYLTSDQKARARSNIDAQAFDAALQSIAGLATSANQMLYTTGADTYATTALTAFARTILDDANAAAMRTTLGLAAIAASGSASDISTGTLADARLPGTMANKSFTGDLNLPSVSTSLFRQGNGDGASYAAHNLILKGWWGLGLATYDDTINGFFDFRQGLFDLKGGYRINGVDVWSPLNQLALGTTPASARTAIQLQNVNNTSDANKPVSTAQQQALDLKANLASPAFTGNPSVPTQAQGVNDQRIASTAFVNAAVAAGGGAFVSGQQTITNAGQIVVAHGLGSVPSNANLLLVCTTAENGYSVGDSILLGTMLTDVAGGGEMRGFEILLDATNITALVGANGVVILNKSTKAAVLINNANWRVVLRANK